MGNAASEIVGSLLERRTGLSFTTVAGLHVGCYVLLAAAASAWRRRLSWLDDDRV